MSIIRLNSWGQQIASYWPQIPNNTLFGEYHYIGMNDNYLITPENNVEIDDHDGIPFIRVSVEHHAMDYFVLYNNPLNAIKILNVRGDLIQKLLIEDSVPYIIVRAPMVTELTLPDGIIALVMHNIGFKEIMVPQSLKFLVVPHDIHIINLEELKYRDDVTIIINNKQNEVRRMLDSPTHQLHTQIFKDERITDPLMEMQPFSSNDRTHIIDDGLPTWEDE